MRDRQLFLLTLKSFRKLLASYAFLLLLPLLVSAVIYPAVIAILTREISGANKASLAQMKSLLDAKLREISIMADGLSVNEKVQVVSTARPPLSPYKRLVMGDVQKLLQERKYANSFVEEICLYIPRNGYVLSNVSRYDGAEFAMSAQGTFGMSLEEWRRFLLSGGYRGLRVLKRVGSNGVPPFVFTQRLAPGDTADAPAVLAVLVGSTQLAGLLETLTSDTQRILMISAPDGSVISWPPIPSVPPTLEYDRLGDRREISEIAYMGSRYFAAGTSSDVSDWRYTCLIPSRVYLKSADLVRRMIAAYVVACLCGGLALSFVLARRSYTPIRRLTTMFLERLGQGEGSVKNEFSFLETALQRVLQRNENLESTIRRQNDTVRSGLVARLVRGHVPHLDVLLTSLSACGAVFPSENCLLIAVVTGLEHAPPLDQEAPTDREAEELVQYMLQTVLEEVARKRHSAYATEVDGTTLCLVSLSTPAAEDPGWRRSVQEMTDITERVRALFTGRLGIRLSLAVSGVVESFTDLPRAAAEVRDLIDGMELDARHSAPRSEGNGLNGKQVVAYVEERFSRKDLNVNAIADAFGVSVSHLSRFFKKTTGVGLLDYIHLLRVREAKKLIRENRMNVQEVALRVGYSTRITMVRAFKKYVGMAPAAFRDMVR